MAVSTTGHVYLVGAGPGNPNLLTRKAEHLIRTADIVLYDRLVNPFILQLAAPGIEIVDVGKKPYSRHIQQGEINDIIVEAAYKHQKVVRLKGGDPAIFARVQEEVEVLKSHQIPCEIVPGITTASAAAAALGIGLTSRNISKSVTFTTGSFKDSQEQEIDIASLIDGGTLAIYMGIKRLHTIISQIYKQVGKDYPICAIFNVSYSNQVVIQGKLSTIEDDVREAAPDDAPGILLVGDAMALTDGPTFIETDHLPEYFGKQCIVTGDREAAINKAFEIYDAGGYAMIDPNTGDEYHQSQLDLIYRFMQMDDITEIIKA
ncbi:uroporphyrinogen-III C-methyltransferase [Staphylococcus simulans]|uniref:uroporphyrinogen-III C-methyltransferase n=1 Tax=Staphylococcus simulans TaxID=1286 RepID=UPI003F7EF951